MNRVEIQGGVTRDPTLRETKNGYHVCEVTLAVNGCRYDAQKREQVVQTTYVAVVFYGEWAEIVSQRHRGDELYVIGEISQEVREKSDGKTETKTKVRGHWFNVTRRSSGRTRSVEQTQKDDGYDPDEDPF